VDVFKQILFNIVTKDVSSNTLNRWVFVQNRSRLIHDKNAVREILHESLTLFL